MHAFLIWCLGWAMRLIIQEKPLLNFIYAHHQLLKCKFMCVCLSALVNDYVFVLQWTRLCSIRNGNIYFTAGILPIHYVFNWYFVKASRFSPFCYYFIYKTLNLSTSYYFVLLVQERHNFKFYILRKTFYKCKTNSYR